MENSVKDIIRARKSVRTYRDEPLRPSDRQKLKDYLDTLSNPFGVSVDFRMLDAKEFDISSPVIIGAREYVAVKARRVPRYEIACGYSFEKFCLYAKTLGIGTVMLAGTISRNTAEKAMDVQDDEVMPVASPVGYPADKPSLREKMMRKGIKADERLPFESVFFYNSFAASLKSEDAGMFQDALEMVRLAPSAANKQPWRVVVFENKAHFYEKKTSMSKNPLGDIQKFDIGIALSHFELTLNEENITGHFIEEDPGISSAEDTEYIITYEVDS